MSDLKGSLSCPKCGVSQAASPECSHCGIIFAKYLAHQRQAAAGATPAGGQPTMARAQRTSGGDPVLQGAMQRLLNGEDPGPKVAPAAQQTQRTPTRPMKTLPPPTFSERLVTRGKTLLGVLLAALVSSKSGGTVPPTNRGGNR
jgi:rubredoxin